MNQSPAPLAATNCQVIRGQQEATDAIGAPVKRGQCVSQRRGEHQQRDAGHGGGDLHGRGRGRGCGCGQHRRPWCGADNR